MSFTNGKMAVSLAALACECADDSIKTNSRASSNAGLETKIVRTYDGVGVHDGKDPCQWCLDRQGTFDSDSAYAYGVFERHDGCGCEIAYTSRKGVTTYQYGKGGWFDSARTAVRIGNDKTARMDGMEFVGEVCKTAKVKHHKVKKLQRILSDDEIITKIGGGDRTKGSCSSLAFAYAGNKQGLDVTDFRGGASLDVFAKNINIKKIAKSDKVRSFVIEEYNGFKGTSQALNLMEEGKEYYLATGDHVAIVRLTPNAKFEYLELQSVDHNGFHELTREKLKKRFGVTATKKCLGTKMKQEVYLIDIESLGENESFENILGYINTDIAKQQKGVGGYAK